MPRASLPHPPGATSFTRRPGLLPGLSIRSRDHSCRKPRARAFPARLLTGRHFPLLKGEKNFPNVILKEPSKIYFTISSSMKGTGEAAQHCLTGTRSPWFFTWSLGARAAGVVPAGPGAGVSPEVQCAAFSASPAVLQPLDPHKPLGLRAPVQLAPLLPELPAPLPPSRRHKCSPPGSKFYAGRAPWVPRGKPMSATLQNPLSSLPDWGAGVRTASPVPEDRPWDQPGAAQEHSESEKPDLGDTAGFRVWVTIHLLESLGGKFPSVEVRGTPVIFSL